MSARWFPSSLRGAGPFPFANRLRRFFAPPPASGAARLESAQQLQAALIESRQRYKDLVEIASDFAWETGRDGAFVFVSPRGALGYTATELVGRELKTLLWDTDGDGDEALKPFVTREPIENVQLWLRRADGTAACVLVSALPLRDPDGSWRGARGLCRDVTEARARDVALARANTRERLLAYILRALRDSADLAEMLDAAAKATARALGVAICHVHRGPDSQGGFSRAAGTEDSSGDHATPDDLMSRVVAADDPFVHGPWLVAAARHQGAVNGVVAVRRDPGGAAWSADDTALIARVADHLGIAIAQLADHERLRELSRTDGLTGLLNRRTFYEELQRRWSRAGRDGKGALIYCDLDNFKLVNDRSGHGAGDDALRRIAAILSDSTRGLDLVARLGGDEFALWLEGADRAGAERKAQAILDAVAPLAPLSCDAARPFAVSLGLALPRGDTRPPGCVNSTESLDDFLARADAAMYAAKQAGKGRFAIAETPPIGSIARAAS